MALIYDGHRMRERYPGEKNPNPSVFNVIFQFVGVMVYWLVARGVRGKSANSK